MIWDNSKWYHLAAVHGASGGSKQRIYVDGELFLEQNRSGSINWGNQMLVFGARNHNGSFGWHSNTYLDDIRFYERALLPSEVEVLAGPILNKVQGTFGKHLDLQLETNSGSVFFEITAGQLPPGLVINAATGSISGIPLSVGDFNATVKISNQLGEDSKILGSESIVQIRH